MELGIHGVAFVVGRFRQAPALPVNGRTVRRIGIAGIAIQGNRVLVQWVGSRGCAPSRRFSGCGVHWQAVDGQWTVRWGPPPYSEPIQRLYGGGDHCKRCERHCQRGALTHL